MRYLTVLLMGGPLFLIANTPESNTLSTYVEAFIIMFSGGALMIYLMVKVPFVAEKNPRRRVKPY